MTGPLKWHGGKKYLAPRIVELFPPKVRNPNKPAPDDPGYLHFVEPYAGGLSVLLANDPEGVSEVVSDTNGRLTNFWQCMADRDAFDKLQRFALAQPTFNEILYQQACLKLATPCKAPPNKACAPCGWAFFIACRMSLAGRMKNFTGITRTRTRKGMNAEVAAYLGSIEGLPHVHERLSRVLVLNRPALKVIKAEDGPRTLYYIDPPYMHDTRATTTEYGEHEMTTEDHEDLLTALGRVKGRFLLSGYRNDLYDDYASRNDWRRKDFSIANHASGAKVKTRMVESVWLNYDPPGGV